MNGQMEERFPALLTISAILKIVAVIVAIVGVIAAFGSFFAAVAFIGKLGLFIGALITTAINTLLIWAASEFLVLLVSVERNTYMMVKTEKPEIKAA